MTILASKTQFSHYNLSRMALSFLARIFAYPNPLGPSVFDILREILTCTLIHVVLCTAYCHLTCLLCDIINLCSAKKPRRVENLVANLGISHTVCGEPTVLYAYITVWILNALLLHLHDHDRSGSYWFLVKSIAWVYVETLFFFGIALAMTLLLRLLKTVSGAGPDDDANRDKFKMRKGRNGSDEETGEAMVDKKTVL